MKEKVIGTGKRQIYRQIDGHINNGIYNIKATERLTWGIYDNPKYSQTRIYSYA